MWPLSEWWRGFNFPSQPEFKSLLPHFSFSSCILVLFFISWTHCSFTRKSMSQSPLMTTLKFTLSDPKRSTCFEPHLGLKRAFDILFHKFPHYMQSLSKPKRLMSNGRVVVYWECVKHLSYCPCVNINLTTTQPACIDYIDICFWCVYDLLKRHRWDYRFFGRTSIHVIKGLTYPTLVH